MERASRSRCHRISIVLKACVVLGQIYRLSSSLCRNYLDCFFFVVWLPILIVCMARLHCGPTLKLRARARPLSELWLKMRCGLRARAHARAHTSSSGFVDRALFPDAVLRFFYVKVEENQQPARALSLLAAIQTANSFFLLSP